MTFSTEVKHVGIRQSSLKLQPFFQYASSSPADKALEPKQARRNKTELRR